MTVYELMAKMGAVGIKLWVEEGQLKFKAPKGALTPELKQNLIDNKQAVIDFLSETKVVESGGGATLPKVDRQGFIPLSHAQQRLWFIEQLTPGSSTFHIPAALYLSGILDVEALQRAFLKLIQRHEALRTVFLLQGEEPAQVVRDIDHFPIPFESLMDLPEQDRMQAVKSKVEQEVRTSFDLSVGPLIRARLYKLDDNKHGLIVTMHHIVTDGWSMGVFVREISALYAAERMGAQAPLPELEIQYADFAAWQRDWLQGDELDRQLSYWRKALHAAPAQLALPFDRPRPALQTLNGATRTITIDEQLTARLRAVAREFDTTLYVVFMAAYKLVLSKWAQQQDLCVGMPVAGRTRAEVEGLIGFFVNTLVIRTDLKGNPSFRQLVAQVKDKVLGAQSHQDVPFEAIVEELNTPRNLSFSPLYQVALSLTSGDGTARKAVLGGLEIEPMPIELVAARLDLTMMLADHGDCVDGMLEYNTDLFNERTITRFIDHFCRALTLLCENLDQNIDAVQLYQEQDLLQLLAPEGSFDAALPLTPMQRDFCLDSLREPDSNRNAIGYHVNLPQVEARQVKAALQQVADANPLLRSRIVTCDVPGADPLYQLICAHREIELLEHDWSDIAVDEPQFMERVSALALPAWNIEAQPLVRYHLVRWSEARHCLIVAAHHSVFDGISKLRHFQQFVAAYNGEPVASTPLEEVRSWILNRMAVSDRNATLAYWRDQLKQHESVAVKRQQPGEAVSQNWTIGAEHYEQLVNFCQRHGVSQANYLRTLYTVALQQCFYHSEEFVLVDAGAGRSDANSQWIGCLFQFTPHVQHAITAGTFDELLIQNRQWKKSVGDAQFLSMLSRSELLSADALEFQFNYRLPEISRPLTLQGNEVVLQPMQPDNPGTVKLLVTPSDASVQIRLSYRENEFAGFQLLERMARVHEQILNTTTELNQHDWLFSEERDELLAIARGGSRPVGPTLLQRFSEQVARSPGSAAVIWDDQVLTYEQLDALSNQVANWLVANKITDQSRVAVCVSRNLTLVPLYLGVIKSGAAYVPLDSHYPAERLAFILQDSAADALISESCVLDRFTAGEASIPESTALLIVDNLEAALAEVPADGPAAAVNLDSLLYYVYTSGSTGQPKGAGVYQRGEANLLDWYQDLLQCDHNDRFLLMSAIGFDLTQKNLFAPLCSGGALVIPTAAEYDPDSLVADIEKHNVTVVNCAPSAFYPLLESAHRIRSLRHVVLGGEPIRLDIMGRWLAERGTNATLTNSYGPTECSDVVSSYSVQSIPPATESLPIGVPTPNTALYIVNKQGNLMPRGAAGELRVAGEGVGAGYWQRPELNAESFRPCPFSEGRWYRTGDICRLDEDGRYCYIGRADFQVKLRGLRIELGEIDSKLKILPGVQDAISLVRNDTLVSYVLTDTALDVDAAKAELRRLLPEFMVPASIVGVAVWPLTPNGKVDRKALPEPDVSGAAEVVSPRNESEQQIADIWCQVLKLPHISVKANFFESGGHSLLATQVVSRIRKAFNVELSVRALFEAPTIEKLVRYISTAASTSVADAPPLIALDPPNRDTLSFAQYRLWFVDQLNQGSSEYNLPSALKIKGALDIAVLDRVFGEIATRHEVLRTNFGECDGVPRLLVHEPQPWRSELIDLSHLDPTAQQQQVTHWVDEDAARIYSLQDDALFTTRILKLDEDTHILLLNMHHIVSDGWSLGVLVQEIQALYPAFAAGQGSPLPPLPIQYSDFAVWQRNWLQGEVLESLRRYWQDALRGAPDVLRLPTDKPRPKHQTFNGAHYQVTLGESLSARLARFCEQNDFTPFMVLMGAYQLMLSRYAGQQDICVGIPIAGRNRAELEGLIGFFINGLVIRTRLEDNPSVMDYLNQVKEVSLGAYAHQDMPADLLLDAIKMERTADTSPGAQVGFALQNVAQESLQAEMAGLSIETVPREHKTAKYELSLILQEGEAGLGGVFEYNTDLFEESTIARMTHHFLRVLDRFIDQPAQMVDQVQMVAVESLYDALAIDSGRYELRTLSPMQRDMVLDTLVQPDTLKNSLGYHFITDGEFDVDAWVAASKKLVQDHPLLRAGIVVSDLPYTDVAYLCIDKNGSVEPVIEDWTDRQTSDEAAAQHAQSLIWQPYDIAGALSQYFIFKLDRGRHLVVFRMNHIILDGAGMAVHLKHSIAYTQALRSGMPCQPAPDIFAQYVEDNRRRTDSAAVVAFWKQQSSSLEALDFAILPSQKAQARRVEQSIRLTDQHWDRLQAFCTQHRITPSLYFKALYGLLINAYCRGEDDFFVSEVVGGRVGQQQRAFGNYFQVMPVVYPKELFRRDAKVGDLFSHIRQYRKSLRANANVSLLAQGRLLPQGRLNFMFNYYNFIPSMTLFGDAIKLKAYPQLQDGPVQFVVHQQDGWLELNLIYMADLFADLAFLPRLEQLSQQILDGVGNIGKLELRLPQEQVPPPTTAGQPLEMATVVHGFLRQKDLTPQAIAVRKGQEQLTYAQLHQQSDALAAILRQRGVDRGERVGICLDRGVDMLVAVLAVLKCGAAYVPMDSNYPAQRLAYILEDSGAQVLITQRCVRERLEDVLQGNAAQVLELDVDSAWRDAAADTSTTLPQPEDAIYVIYTSGSTGQPKGAEVRHSGEVNLQSWYINDLGLTAADRFFLMGAFGFDLTQKNLFAPLLVGGALVIPDMSDFDLEVIARTLESENITVVNCAPSAFYPLVEDPSKAGYPFPSLRYLILGGEPIRQEALLPWLKAGGCKLVNSYGPTECTDVVSYHVFDPARDSAVIPIGKAIGNTQLYIVDNADHLLPPGIVGELCIGGAGVGNGYLNRPDLSQSVFQQNPYCSEGQWYRTGDLVRARPDGTIEYVGRKDFQVKIRGLRIELGEIEAALNGLPEVQDSLILVKNEQLVAYVIAPAGLATESVKARLRSSLPDYMVPASVVTLEQWPLTPNGKVDRKALPDPDHSGRPPYVAPRNETEEKLAQIWSEVLGVSDIGIHDSFFDLGGHSLLAARAVSKFRQAFEVDIQLRSLFELHTIADIAQYLDTMKWAAQTAEQQVGSSAEESGRDEGFL